MARTVDVSFPSGSGRPMRGALARPDAATPRPGVLVLHDVYGLVDDVRRIAGRIAELGYVALVPDLYDTGHPKPLCIVRTFLAMKRGEGPAFADLDAANRWLAARDDVDGERLAAVGFCLGGGFALLYGVRAPLRATGVFYGDVPKRVEALRGVCPVVAGYGERDRLYAPQGDRLRAHLEALGVPHDYRSYPDVGHSYMNHLHGLGAALAAWGPLATRFDPAADADSWDRLARFFRSHLG
jgi:carboxymethylenebutenolidase